MTPRLYKAAEVCDLAQLQPYVLRSWEKEFPGIGVQKSEDGPRFYRQSDVDQVLRIMLHGRMQYGMERYEAEHPDVDILLIEPTRDDMRMFRYNIMRYSARHIVAQHGYRSAKRQFDAARSLIAPAAPRRHQRARAPRTASAPRRA